MPSSVRSLGDSEEALMLNIKHAVMSSKFIQRSSYDISDSNSSIIICIDITDSSQIESVRTSIIICGLRVKTEKNCTPMYAMLWI